MTARIVVSDDPRIGMRTAEGRLLEADGASIVKAARKLPLSTRIFVASQILEEAVQSEEQTDDMWGIAACLRKPSNDITKVWQAIMNGEL